MGQPSAIEALANGKAKRSVAVTEGREQAKSAVRCALLANEFAPPKVLRT